MNIDKGSHAIPSEDRDLVILKNYILIPEGARRCHNCEDNRRVSIAAIERVISSLISHKKLTFNDVQLLITRLQDLFENKNIYILITLSL